MSAADLASLPADVVGAFRSSFGDTPIERLAALGGGLSRALLFSFAAGGAEYVLRKGDAAAAARAHTCMRIAADRGVAPRVRYLDAQAAISIVDRVAGEALGRAQSLAPRRLERVAATLRRLHDGPAFPKGPALAEVLGSFETQVMARSGAGLPAAIARSLQAATPCLARFRETAPCHNDLNPNNVLETEEQVFFVDWDAAAAGDPFLDLAQFGVFAFPQREGRDALLEAYLARRPTAVEKARATVTRVVALGLYAAAFFYVQSLAGEPRVDGVEATPLSDLLRALAVARERTSPGVVAGALLREMQDEHDNGDFADATRVVARST